MTDEQLVEWLASIDERQRATAGSVRALVQALSSAEANRTGERDRFSSVEKALDRTTTAVLQLIAARAEKILSEATGEDLANHVSNAAICHARNIQWARKRGEPEPLPLTPNAPTHIARETSSGGVEMVPIIHPHRRAGDDAPHQHRRKDDSVTIKTQGGQTRIKADVSAKAVGQWVKSYVGWAVGVGVAIYEAVKAALHH